MPSILPTTRTPTSLKSRSLHQHSHPGATAFPRYPVRGPVVLAEKDIPTPTPSSTSDASPFLSRATALADGSEALPIHADAHQTAWPDAGPPTSVAIGASPDICLTLWNPASALPSSASPAPSGAPSHLMVIGHTDTFDPSGNP